MDILNSDGKVIPHLITKGASVKPWDAAHQARENSLDGDGPQYAEPDFLNELYSAVDPETELNSAIADLEAYSTSHYLKNWPQPPEMQDRFVWHLTDDFSGFFKANKKLQTKIHNPLVRVAHIDTGYQPGHPALPKNLKRDKSRSFIKGENGGPAVDIRSGGKIEQDGHGTATMILLAGNKAEKSQTDGAYEGFVGAAPFAEILSLRISETVALIQTSSFVEAVEYAIAEECEVISMSMAGAPSKAWATAVNKAYEAGITIVCAAGNSWFEGPRKALPKRVLYPARWERVIAATGVACDNLPYVLEARLQKKFEGGETMQGNFGPAEVMQHALAAYTPNVFWATLNEEDAFFRPDGGGTSSATPQVAAAAALYLAYYRDEIAQQLQKFPGEKWRKVEMVKNALFASADRHSYPLHLIYLGRGIVKADKALDIPPDATAVTKAPEAGVNLWGILDLLGLLLRLKENVSAAEDTVRAEMFQTEILQQMHLNPKLQKFLDYGENEIWNEADRRAIREELLQSPTVSDTLKNYLQNLEDTAP